MGPDGGGVGALAVAPGAPDTLYALTGSGLFKSNDGAQSWRRIDSLAAPFSGQVLIDRQDAKVVYVRGFSSFFRSRDGGATWTSANSGLPAASGNVAIDPNDSRRLYAATGSGLHMSENGGDTWIRLGQAGDTVRRFVVHVAVHPSNSDILFIVLPSSGAGATDGGIHRSADRGQTWRRVNPEEVDRIVGHRGFPDRLYAYRNAGGNTVRILRSLDRGETWTVIFQKSDPKLFLRNLVLDPISGAARFAAAASGAIQSSDGGLNWSDANAAPGDRPASDIATDGRNPQTIYLAAGIRGVLKSQDEASTWQPASFGLAAFAPFQLLVHPSDPRILYVLRGLTELSVQKSSDGGDTWRELSGYTGQVGSMRLDQNNPDTLYLATGRSLSFAAGDAWQCWRSRDGGATWSLRGDIIAQSANFLTTQWVADLAVDPRDSNRVYAAAFGAIGSGQQSERSGVYRSTDGGANWTRVLEAGDLFTVLLDPSNPDVVYAGSGANIVGDGVYKSTNRGEAWTRMNTGLPNTAIQNLTIDRRNPQRLYARPLLEGMYRTVNGGSSWSPYQAGGQEAREVGFHPTQSVAYASTPSGVVLRSRDGGTTWQPIGAPGGLPSQFGFVSGDPDLVFALAGSQVRRFPAPLWLYAPGDPARTGSRFDGVAVSNPGDSTAVLTLAQLAGGGGVEAQSFGLDPMGAPPRLTLAPHQQVARLRSELFGGDVSPPSWIELISDNQVSTFFQYGANDLSQLDGGVAAETAARRIIFRQVFEGAAAFRGQTARTRLSVFNPGRLPVTVRLRYFPPGLGQAAPAAAFEVELQVPARGFRDESAGALFPGVLNGGWVEAVTEEGPGIVGFAVVEFPAARTLLGLGAVSDDSSRNLYSAQFATAPGTLFTDVNLVNIGRAARRATLAAVSGDGVPLGTPVLVDLTPGQSWTREAGQLFPLAGPFVGSLRVEVDGEGVVGGVVFGDPARAEFAASLALQPQPFTDAVFNQVASLSGFFTGLAFFYSEADPTAPAAQITIDVFRANGQSAGQAMRTLSPGSRLSALVEELVPAAAGQSGGYLRIVSSRPVIGQVLFGSVQAGTIRLFSAVPAGTL